MSARSLSRHQGIPQPQWPVLGCPTLTTAGSDAGIGFRLPPWSQIAPPPPPPPPALPPAAVEEGRGEGETETGGPPVPALLVLLLLEGEASGFGRSGCGCGEAEREGGCDEGAEPGAFEGSASSGL